MKDAIDHVLPWIRPEIVEHQLAEIASREVGEPVSVVAFKLKEKGRYYGWNGFGPSEIDLVPPKGRRGANFSANRPGLT